MRIEFAKPEEGDVEAAAGVEVELRGGVEHGGGVARVAEQHAVHQRAAVGAVLDGLVDAMLFAARGNQLGHRIGHADAVVDDRARLAGVEQFARGTPGHGLALAEGFARGRVHGGQVGAFAVQPRRAGQFAAEGRIERNVVARFLIRIDHDGIDPG